MADRPAKCSSCDVPAQVILEDNIPQKVVCPPVWDVGELRGIPAIGWPPSFGLCLQGIGQSL